MCRTAVALLLPIISGRCGGNVGTNAPTISPGLAPRNALVAVAYSLLLVSVHLAVAFVRRVWDGASV